MDDLPRLPAKSTRPRLRRAHLEYGRDPYKLHVRSPSFVHMGGLHRLLEGYQLADSRRSGSS
jgi:hypothetical protein